MPYYKLLLGGQYPRLRFKKVLEVFASKHCSECHVQAASNLINVHAQLMLHRSSHTTLSGETARAQACG